MGCGVVQCFIGGVAMGSFSGGVYYTGLGGRFGEGRGCVRIGKGGYAS